MVAGGLRVCNAAYGQNGWPGLRIDQRRRQRPHHVQGTTKANDSYGRYFAQTPGEDHHVMCQEIGHTYGLAHTSEDGTSQDTHGLLVQPDQPVAERPRLRGAGPHLRPPRRLRLYSTGTWRRRWRLHGPAPPRLQQAGRADAMPPGAALLHYHAGRGGHTGHAEYALADGDGGTWVFHLTLLPEDARRR
ncbi:MAG: hypothetical protein U0470_10600 [Anaerolineae bacterium]